MSAKDLPENFLPGPPKEAAKKTVVNWNPGCVIPQDSRRRRRRRRWFAAARAKKEQARTHAPWVAVNNTLLQK